MKYAELKNDAGSYLIDDTYVNCRLAAVQSLGGFGALSGVHIELDKNHDRICTFPYLDYANGHSYPWPSSSPTPLISLGETHIEPQLERFRRFVPHYYIGSPFIFPTRGSGSGYGHLCVRPTMWLEFGSRGLSYGKRIGLTIPHMFALASAMPNIIYTFTQYSHPSDRTFPFRYFVNLWQRAASVNLPIYKNSTFSGQDVGYTELERVDPYNAWVGTNLKSYFKVKDNEKFQYWTFEQEARLSTMVYAYGIDGGKDISDRGEMIVKNERGETIFNNRYDYMRVLKYLPAINTLAISGKDLYNSPKRFSFPGRKIAVVALHPYCCIASSPQGTDQGFLFNTGFWFPDPSTVEFTTCATMNGQLFNTEPYQTPAPSVVKMAELLNVMILDVTGCTPGWRYEAETGLPAITML